MIYSTKIKTPLGTFHLSADEKGLTTITLPGSPAPSGKEPTEGSVEKASLELAAQQIQEYCIGERREFDIPLSINGTRFQLEVWNIIRGIPYGHTMSYGEIARKLGGIGKARAVGGAANANHLPLVIPCHRVIGSDASLTGFAGGIKLKERLLNQEQKYLEK